MHPGFAIFVRGKIGDKSTYEAKIDRFDAVGYVGRFHAGNGEPLWFPTRTMAESHLRWQYEKNVIAWHFNDVFKRANKEQQP